MGNERSVTVVHPLSPRGDWKYIEAATAAVKDELMDQSEIIDAIASQSISAYILWVGHIRRSCLVVDTRTGLPCLACYYRTGPAHGLRADSKYLLDRVLADLRSNGFSHACLLVSKLNPNAKRLERFYKSLMFETDLVRMTREI